MLEDIKCDWSELVNPQNQQKYYYNSKTQQSTYTRPKEYDLYVAKLKIKLQLDRISNKKERNDEPSNVNKNDRVELLEDESPKLVDSDYEDLDQEKLAEIVKLKPIVDEIEAIRKEMLADKSLALAEKPTNSSASTDNEMKKEESDSSESIDGNFAQYDEINSKSLALISNLKEIGESALHRRISFETRWKDWQSGHLKTEYFISKIEELEKEIK